MNPVKVFTYAICFAVMQSLWANAPTEPAIYTIKQLDPTTGSNIKRNVVYGSVVPINKTYSELTDAQLKAIKSQYVRMGDGDEPPFPEKGLRSVYQNVSMLQKKLLVTGILDVEVDINETGEATAVRVFKSPDEDITKAVAAVLMMERYKPAVCAGTPCKMGFPFTINFRVRR